MVSLHRCVDEVFIVYKSPEDFRQYTNVHTVRSMTRLPFQLEKNPLQPFREQKVKKKKHTRAFSSSATASSTK